MEERPLYLVLESSADATPEELRRAYHRLALQYHPDKAGPESAEKFQQILAAYTLLSDPEAREVYDRYGEQGLSNMEAMPAMAEVGRNISIISFFRVGFAILGLVSAHFIVLFAMVSLKLDGHANYSWHVAVIPAYILFLAFSVATVVSIAVKTRKYVCFYMRRKDQNTDPRTPTTQLFDEILLPNNRAKLMKEVRFWFGHFISVCVILSVFLIVVSLAQREIKTDGRHLNWFVVFSPSFVANVASVFMAFVFRDVLHLYGIHSVSTLGLVILNALSLLMSAIRVTQIALLLCVMEGYLDIAAYYVAIPAEVYIVVNCLFMLTITRLRVQGIDKIKREMPYMSEEAREEHLRAVGKRPSWWIEIVFVAFASVCMLAGIITSTLADVIGCQYRLAFIPFFILFGGILLSSVVLFICFTIAIGGVAEHDTTEIQRNCESADDEEERTAEGKPNSERPPFSPTSSNVKEPQPGSRNRNSREGRDSGEGSQGESYPQQPASPRTPTFPNANGRRSADDCRVECCQDFEVDSNNNSFNNKNGKRHSLHIQQQRGSDFRFEYDV